MRNTMTLAILAMFAVLGSSAHAAKRTCSPNPDGLGQTCLVTTSNSTVPQLPNFGQGNRCIIDEGYGRWSYCDSN
jgi:hypothetical protein